MTGSLRAVLTVACVVVVACVPRYRGNTQQSGDRSYGPGVEPHPPPASGWPSLSENLPKAGGGEKDAVLIIALEKYDHLPAVEGANVSGDDWDTYFKQVRGTPNAQVTRLSGDVSARKMRSALEESASLARQTGGRLWFVFVGHGYQSGKGEKVDGILVESNSLADDVTGLSHKELMDLLKRGSGKGLAPVAVLDACYSGTTTSKDGKVTSTTGEQRTSIVFEPETPKEVTVLSAASSEQPAYPLPMHEPRRPGFSYLMLGALMGWADEEGGDNDGAVSTDEAINYVRNTLQQFGAKQRPESRSNSADLALVKLATSGRIPPPNIKQILNPPHSPPGGSGGGHPGVPPGPGTTDKPPGPGTGTGGFGPGTEASPPRPPVTRNDRDIPRSVQPPHMHLVIDGEPVCVKTAGPRGTLERLERRLMYDIWLDRAQDGTYFWVGQDPYDGVTFQLVMSERRGFWTFQKLCERGMCVPVHDQFLP